ncbi:MAG: phosphoribosylamine--glycine ligase [bacterium]|nr:phosphoribosylamine--glycine ligase [bacterium]
MTTAKRVLIVGGGGREHALAWALAKSPQIVPLGGQIFIAPGNGGTALMPQVENVPIAAEDAAGQLTFALANNIDLTVVGPEVPLSLGIVDVFQQEGLQIFGPTQAAAQLETSKAFARAFMQQNHIPSPHYGTFSDFEAARQFVLDFGQPVVVKADGLAAGKGVIVCDDAQQAEDALRQIMLDRAFGQAGEQIVIEERLEGPELSVLAFTDGNTVVMMPPARDHKRIFDGDEGPNTGGMGAVAPVPGVTSAFLNEIQQTILQPAVDGMRAAGTPYSGVLYAGLMLTSKGAKVLEFNCRFGDPEAQTILPLLESDLFDLLWRCTAGTVDQAEIRWKAGTCVTVVAAAPGYPGEYPKGIPISGLENVQDAFVFHAGTAIRDDQIVTAGGRVLCVTATGEDLDTALDTAYSNLSKMHFDGIHYRRDIGRTSTDRVEA